MFRSTYILLLLAATVVACEKHETIEASYPDFQSAQKAGAIHGPALPSNLIPRSAKDIRSAFNLDTNEFWMSFRFAPADLSTMLSSCKDVPSSQVSYAYRSPPGSWWPGTLTQRASDVANRSAFKTYQCEGGGIIAVDTDKGIAFYWRLKV